MTLEELRDPQRFTKIVTQMFKRSGNKRYFTDKFYEQVRRASAGAALAPTEFRDLKMRAKQLYDELKNSKRQSSPAKQSPKESRLELTDRSNVVERINGVHR